MNKDEEIAETFLKTKYKTVVFEPDGNIPPDFLVDNRIAVEVTRLNQNLCANNGQRRGLEEESIPLIQKVQALLRKHGAGSENQSWLVSIRFKRPIDNWQKLSIDINECLNGVKQKKLKEHSVFNITSNFQLKVTPHINIDHQFTLAIATDQDLSGFIFSKIEENLKYIIRKKTTKISKYQEKYNEWWLILPDYIGYGLKEFEYQQLRESFPDFTPWKKVILINPLNPQSHFEL